MSPGQTLHTSQTPLRKRSWSVTYMGSVSQRLLVRVTLMPRLSISAQARSISATRSPKLPPSAMYAVVVLLAPRQPHPAYDRRLAGRTGSAGEQARRERALADGDRTAPAMAREVRVRGVLARTRRQAEGQATRTSAPEDRWEFMCAIGLAGDGSPKRALLAHRELCAVLVIEEAGGCGARFFCKAPPAGG